MSVKNLFRITVTILFAIIDAKVTKDKTCKEMFDALKTQTKWNPTKMTTDIAKKLSIASGNNIDMIMQVRDKDVSGLGMTECNMQRTKMFDNAINFNGYFISKAWYWYLFFAYWEFDNGNVFCSDGDFKRCLLKRGNGDPANDYEPNLAMSTDFTWNYYC